MLRGRFTPRFWRRDHGHVTLRPVAKLDWDFDGAGKWRSPAHRAWARAQARNEAPPERTPGQLPLAAFVDQVTRLLGREGCAQWLDRDSADFQLACARLLLSVKVIPVVTGNGDVARKVRRLTVQLAGAKPGNAA
jgi:hypothetical protein